MGQHFSKLELDQGLIQPNLSHLLQKYKNFSFSPSIIKVKVKKLKKKKKSHAPTICHYLLNKKKK